MKTIAGYGRVDLLCILRNRVADAPPSQVLGTGPLL